MRDEIDYLQIKQVSAKLRIPAVFIEKDFFITKVIYLLTRIQNEYFSLVFQGGTSLSKGYQIVQRLSEDVDFRIIQKPAAKKLGKESRRKKLREFRHDLIKTLQNAGFIVPEELVRTFYEGRFMSIGAQFNHSSKITYLKPHIAIECFLGELLLDARSTDVTTIIKLSLGERCDHHSFPVVCVALDETAAEKWVALTRRVANSTIRPRKSDKHLVRHLYDLYHLNVGGFLTGEYCNIVESIMQKDRVQFKKHNQDYADDPIRLSQFALDTLYNDHQWQNHWIIFLDQMVYEQTKPSFDEAYDHLQLLSQKVFESLASETVH